MAREAPDERALEWCNPAGEARTFSFADISRESSRCANMLSSLGVGRGDVVMLVLKRHYEFWFAIMALHKLGAVAVPATHLLTKKGHHLPRQRRGHQGGDRHRRGRFCRPVGRRAARMPSLKIRVAVRGERAGWLSFDEEMKKHGDHFDRPLPLNNNDDPLLIYFTSGTSGMPKMVLLDCSYPLGHIQTACTGCAARRAGCT
jgi:acetyl-CoA synthetase